MTNLEHALSTPGYRPLSGHCVIALDPLADKIGSLFVPQSAQALRVTDISHTGRVLHMTPRKNKNGMSSYELFSAGDRVVVMLLAKDLQDKVISTLNTRVYAVIEDGQQQHTYPDGDKSFKEVCKEAGWGN